MKNKSILNNSEILCVGGSGSLGKTVTKILATEYKPKGIRIFSRGEELQWRMKNDISNWDKLNTNIAFLIGDVRDKDRLSRAMNRVDYVFNFSAMKQVPACENNPVEAVRTNIDGSINILNTAIDNNVKKVMHISTDKAVSAINLYGATKAVAEKLFIHGNTYSPHGTKFSCCRYGNVLGSRGSIIPLFKKQIEETGKITITDKRMTRFWITLDSVARFIIDRMIYMKGAEIFIPKMPSMKVIDIAILLAHDYCYREGKEIEIKEIGIRKGEKLHELLTCFEETPFIEEQEDKLIIRPLKEVDNYKYSWVYSSDLNKKWLTQNQLRKMIEGLK